MLDEPFEAVDPISATTIRQILEGYAASGGTGRAGSEKIGAVDQRSKALFYAVI